MRLQAAAALTGAILLAVPAAYAQPAPPTNLTAADHPWDNGTRIDLEWSPSIDDARLQAYMVAKKAADETAFTPVDVVPAGTNKFTVAALSPGRAYLFEVKALGRDSVE